MNLRFIGLMALQFTLTVTPTLSQVTTSQYDNARTGATLSEKILTPRNVNSQHFGKLGAFKIDGPVYAQPLWGSALFHAGADTLLIIGIFSGVKT